MPQPTAGRPPPQTLVDALPIFKDVVGVVFEARQRRLDGNCANCGEERATTGRLLGPACERKAEEKALDIGDALTRRAGAIFFDRLAQSMFGRRK